MTVYISNPFPIFLDKNGHALENGYIYIGAANSNPETSPVSVYFDDALTIPAPNPVRTINGYPSRQGTPAQIFTASNCSITVKDKQKNLIFNAALVYAANSLAVNVATIADLKNIVGMSNQKVSTLGYYSIGDGGANNFYYNSSSVDTDNGGTIIKPSSISGAGRWLAVNPDVCNIKQFGAKYDGSSNDTSYVTAAVAACKRVYITGNHTYLFDNVPIFDDSKIVFTGGAKIGLRSGGSGFAFVSTGTSGTHKNRIRIENGRIDGSNTLLGLLSATYTDDIKLIRCRADNLGATNVLQGQLAGFTNCSDILIDNGYCKTACYGVSFTSCTNVLVQGGVYKSLAKDGVLFYNNTTSCKAVGVHVDGYNSLNENGRAGVHFYGGSNGLATGCTVSNCLGSTTDTGAIRFRDFFGFSCTANIINSASVGILTNHIGDFTATAETGSISSNYINTCVNEGISIASTGRCVVSNNVIRNTTKDGIFVGVNSHNCVVSANTISETVNTTARAIIVGSNNTTVIGNNCLIDSALGASNIPQIGYSGTGGIIDSNVFSTASNANLAIRIYSGGSARIGQSNAYGTGITTELVNNGTEIGYFATTIGTSNTVIAHGLNYIPNNISITPFADARVWISSATTSTNINLTASVSVLCQIRVW